MSKINNVFLVIGEDNQAFAAYTRYSAARKMASFYPGAYVESLRLSRETADEVVDPDALYDDDDDWADSGDGGHLQGEDFVTGNSAFTNFDDEDRAPGGDKADEYRRENAEREFTQMINDLMNGRGTDRGASAGPKVVSADDFYDVVDDMLRSGREGMVIGFGGTGDPFSLLSEMLGGTASAPKSEKQASDAKDEKVVDVDEVVAKVKADAEALFTHLRSAGDSIREAVVAEFEAFRKDMESRKKD